MSSDKIKSISVVQGDHRRPSSVIKKERKGMGGGNKWKHFLFAEGFSLYSTHRIHFSTLMQTLYPGSPSFSMFTIQKIV